MKNGWVEPFETRVKNLVECPPQDKAIAEEADDTVDCLKLRVRRSGHAAWYVYLFDEIAKKKSYQKLGDFDAMSLVDARTEARKRQQRASLMAADGISLIAKKEQEKAETALQNKREEKTLRRCLDDYISNNPRLSIAAIKDYKYTITGSKNCSDILDQPVSEITKEWFADRFATIYSRADNAAWKWRTAMHVILKHAEELEPKLFPDGFPILRKSKYGVHDKRRKSDRLDLTYLPELRNRLLTLSEFDRDYVLITLLTGMRSGAVMRLRYDMTCACKDKVGQEKWENGGIQVFEATETKAPKDLIVSDIVRSIILARYQKFGSKSPWLFWARKNTMKSRPERTDMRMADDRWVFEVLDVERNTGKGRVSAHDIRRTFSYIARNVLRLDPVIVAKLMLHSTKNMSVADGYVSLTDADLRRAANEVSGRINKWLKSTAEEIAAEFGDTGKKEELVAFEL